MRVLVFIISGLLTATAWASVPPSVVYVGARPGLNKVLAAAVIKGTYKAAFKTFGSSLITNWKPLGKGPAKAFAACGSDLACLAKLADKLKADRILYGMVAPAAGGGVVLQVVVIGAISETVEQRFAVEVKRPSEAEPAITAQLVALDSAEGLTAPAAAPEPVVVAPAPVAAAPDAGTMDFGDTTVTEPAPVAIKNPPPAAPPRKVGLTLPKELTVQVAQKNTHKSSWLMPTGLVATGLGLGALGTGVYFGLHQDTLMKTIHYGQGGTTQAQAIAITHQANQQAVIADVLFIAGGVLAALGVSFFTASFF